MGKRIDMERYDTILDEVYAAAVAPERWPQALARIADVWGCSKTLLFSAPPEGEPVNFHVSHNISTRALAAYAERTAACDPYIQASNRLNLLSEGTTLLGEVLVPRAELIQTDLYRSIWESEDIGQVCFGVVFDGTDSRKAPVVFSLLRSFNEPTFDEHDRVMLERLVKHLSRALGVMFHLRDREMKLASSLAALNALSGAVLLLGAGQEIGFANHAAKRLLDAGEPLVTSSANGRGGKKEFLSFAPRLGRMKAALDQMLKQAASASMVDEVDHFSKALVIPNEDGSPRCVLHAAPLVAPEDWTHAGITPRVIVFIYDLAAAKVAKGRLQLLFGLTPGEERAALEVLKGGTASEMAERIGVSVATFKTQLQAAYAKTMTHRQADLLKLLLAVGSN